MVSFCNGRCHLNRGHTEKDLSLRSEASGKLYSVASVGDSSDTASFRFMYNSTCIRGMEQNPVLSQRVPTLRAVFFLSFLPSKCHVLTPVFRMGTLM